VTEADTDREARCITRDAGCCRCSSGWPPSRSDDGTAQTAQRTAVPMTVCWWGRCLCARHTMTATVLWFRNSFREGACEVQRV
jgi:hypothetical protein